MEGHENPEVGHDQSLTSAIFGNRLLGDVIASYLSPEDMRMGSLTSTTLYEMIRESTTFLNTMKLALVEIKPFLQNSSIIWEDLKVGSFHWGTVEIDLRLAEKINAFLDDGDNGQILDNIKTLCLSFSPKWYDKYNELPSLIRKDIGDLLTKIFKACAKVTELQVFKELLKRYSFESLISSTLAKKITTLEIVDKYAFWVEDIDLVKTNMDFFSRTFQLTKIKMTVENHYHEFNKCVVKLITSQADWLTTLHLDMFRISGLAFDDCKFPKLKDVKVQHWIDPLAMQFIKFLRNLSSLEFLSVDFNCQCPTEFLVYLQKNSQNMRNFHLATTSLQKIIDWSFLANSSNLVKFSIIRKRRRSTLFNATGVSILSVLPSSLTTLVFRGLKNFWKYENDLDGEDIPDEQIIELLSRYPNMINLILNGCAEGAVKDVVLRAVIDNMPKLKTLKITHGTCSDILLTGLNDGLVHGLKKLTGLTCVVIKSCRNITPNGILGSLKHSNLQSITYRTDHEMSESQLMELVVQNERLTSLKISANFRTISVPDLSANLKSVRHWTVLELADLSPCDSDSDKSYITPEEEDSTEEEESSSDEDFGWEDVFDEYFSSDDDGEEDQNVSDNGEDAGA